MNMFKDYTYSWWQMGIFKLALLCLGAVIGAYWNEFFRANLVLFLVIGLVAGFYVLYISLKK